MPAGFLPLALAACTLLAAQIPQGAAFEGVVRNSVDGHPVPGVKLFLHGGQPPRLYQGETDLTGAFRFEGLPPGGYNLLLEKRGYAQHSAALETGTAAEKIDIRLTPTAALSGRLLGDSGRPLAGAAVWADRMPAETDDDGRFRLQDLPPGDKRLRVNIPLDLRQSTLARDPETGELWGYPAVSFYPGVDSVESAAPVHLGAGLHLDNFEIALRRVRLVDVKGRVLDAATREPLAGGQLELDPEDYPYLDRAYERRPLHRDGGFHFELVTPGRYRLLLYYSKDDPLPQVTPLFIGPEKAQEPIVLAPAPVRIRGRVQPPPGSSGDWGKLVVSLRPELRGLRPRVIVVQDETFEIDRVPPGAFTVEVKSAGPAGNDWYVSEVRFGTTDARKTAITVTESGNPPLEIALLDGGGRISGRVLGSGPGSIVPLVFIQPPGSMEPRNATPMKPDGSFEAGGLAPGEYDVTLAGPAGQACKSATARVTVERRGAAQVELRPCR
jgi:hypothetical protein